MRRVLGLLLVVVCLAPSAATASAAEPGVEVSISRTQVSTRLGQSFGFGTEVRNTGTTPLTGLVAHLNVVGLSSGIYVDPEDWSEQRTKSLAPLGPGESTNLSWNVKAVTGGRVAIYVVVLPDRGPLAISPAMAVQIADTKDLNSGGVLPLALGVPALLGMVTLALRRRRNR